MQKKSMVSRLRKQAGFTMVELSMVLVVGGLLIAAVVKGQDMINVAKAQKLTKDVQNVALLLQQYKGLKGRLPGDCDSSGVIDVVLDTVNNQDTGTDTRAALYDYSVAPITRPADGAVAAKTTDACANTGANATAASSTVVLNTTTVTGANTWLNDLKASGLISDSIVNRNFAKQVNDDFLFVGSINDNGPGNANGAYYNAIVLHNVPQWMAKSMALTMNGNDLTSNKSRLRQLERGTEKGTYAAKWDSPASGATAGSSQDRDALVSLVYFFDAIPTTGVVAN